MLHEGSTTLSTNSKSSEDNHQINNIDKTILLKNILLTKFEKKIKILEKDSNNHLSLINITLNLTKNVTNTCIDLEKRILDKINQKNKLKRNNTNREILTNRNSKIIKNNNNNLISNKTLPRIKTPLLHTSKSQIKFKTPKHNPKILFKSKSNTNILKRRNENQINSRNLIRTSKTFKSLKTQKTVSSLRRKSVLVPNTNETKLLSKNPNSSYYSESGKDTKKDNSFISHQPSIFNKENNLNNSKIQKEKRAKNQSSTNLDYVKTPGKIISEDFEIYLKKNLDLSEDQLLTDIDFKINNNFKTFNSKENDSIKIFSNNNKININEYIDICFENILKYLYIYEIINLKINKKFKNLVNIFMIKKLKTDKEKYSNILYNIQKMEKFDIKKTLLYSNINLTLSNGTKKAIVLLNEPVLNKLWDEVKLPDDDIILVYKIFFQFINHKISKNYWFNLNDIINKINFWKECCNFFKNEKGGKTGTAIEEVMKSNLNFSSKNIYKILNLIDNKLFIFTPSYFTKKCSTTGLFMFFIKDIFDYLGISHDKKTQLKGYNTYQDIIKYIENNIKKMREFV
jgi:hypothetical protein